MKKTRCTKCNKKAPSGAFPLFDQPEFVSSFGHVCRGCLNNNLYVLSGGTMADMRLGDIFDIPGAGTYVYMQPLEKGEHFAAKI